MVIKLPKHATAGNKIRDYCVCPGETFAPIKWGSIIGSCEGKPKFWVMAINGKLAMANLRFSAAATVAATLQCFFDVYVLENFLGPLE